MTINRSSNCSELTIAVGGHLDTTTAPELEAELKNSLPDAQSLVIDLSALDYISSAGLRVLLLVPVHPAFFYLLSRKRVSVVARSSPAHWSVVIRWELPPNGRLYPGRLGGGFLDVAFF